MTPRSIPDVDRELVALLCHLEGQRELAVPDEPLPVAVQRQREQAEQPLGAGELDGAGRVAQARSEALTDRRGVGRPHQRPRVVERSGAGQRLREGGVCGGVVAGPDRSPRRRRRDLESVALGPARSSGSGRTPRRRRPYRLRKRPLGSLLEQLERERGILGQPRPLQQRRVGASQAPPPGTRSRPGGSTAARRVRRWRSGAPRRSRHARGRAGLRPRPLALRRSGAGHVQGHRR